jgi:hypothetical protein
MRRFSVRERAGALVRAAATAGVSAAVLLTSTGMAAAAGYSPAPRAAWVPNGTVQTVLESGGRVYLGGSFTSLRNPATGEVVPRGRLAALDVATGQLVRSFAPTVSSTVYALAATPDGTRVFAGGSFGAVNGTSRGRLAALDTSGRLVPGWSGAANSTVRALAVSAGRLYLGGAFTSANGAVRFRLAAVSTASGALTPWAPTANAYVYSMAVDPHGTGLVVAGQFTRLGGQSRDYLGSVDLAGGAVLPWHPAAQCVSPTNTCYVWDVAVAGAVHGDAVYAAVAGPGGRLVAYDGTTGAQKWRVFANGDVQAVAYADGYVYAGGHFAPDPGDPGVPFAGEVRHQLAAVDASTGVLDAGFAPVFATAYPGVQDISATAGALRVGGAFTGVNRTGHGRYAEFAPVRSTPPLVGAGATWRYRDDSRDPGFAWRAPAFDDAAWRSGRGQFGYGDGDEATVVARGAGLTTYFRTSFGVADPAAVTAMSLDLLADDGAVVYLNGTEMARFNLPAGPVTAATRASTTLSGPAESTYRRTAVSPALLRAGANVLAVEVHNAAVSSSDISFDLRLNASGP